MYEPTNMYYMITIRCNERCSKCSHWKRNDNAPRLSAARIVESLHEFSSIKELCIVGGEPLIFKNEIFNILQGITKLPIRTTIITNGVLLNKDIIDNIKQFNIHIVVSLDTLDKHFWQFVRGHDSYDVVMKNVEYAAKILPSYALSIQSVLAVETERHITTVAQYAKAKGLFHSIQNYVQDGFNGKWTVINEKLPTTSSTTQQCFAAGRNISVMQNGDVFTCFQQNLISGCEKPLGNLNTDSLKNMLNTEYISFVENKMKKCSLPCKVLKCNSK